MQSPIVPSNMTHLCDEQIGLFCLVPVTIFGSAAKTATASYPIRCVSCSNLGSGGLPTSPRSSCRRSMVCLFGMGFSTAGRHPPLMHVRREKKNGFTVTSVRSAVQLFMQMSLCLIDARLQFSCWWKQHAQPFSVSSRPFSFSRVPIPGG